MCVCEGGRDGGREGGSERGREGGRDRERECVCEGGREDNLHLFEEDIKDEAVPPEDVPVEPLPSIQGEVQEERRERDLY